MAYRIVTDSTADLTAELIRQMDVTVLPLHYMIDGKTYTDDVLHPEMTSAEFYSKVRAGSMPTTSQITPEMFRQAIEPMLAAGQDVLYIAFSSGLSGTYNASRLAFEDLRAQYPGRQLVTVDSLAASMGEGMLVYLACAQRDAGKSLAEVAAWVEENRLHLAHWFTVDDLNHLKRGGRVSGATAFFGTMLNIKPVLHVDDAGHLIPMEKVRGRRQSLDALVAHVGKTALHPEQQEMFLSHGDSPADAQYVVSQLKKQYGVKKVHLGDIGPVIGAHSGPGTIALFFLAENRD